MHKLLILLLLLTPLFAHEDALADTHDIDAASEVRALADELWEFMLENSTYLRLQEGLPIEKLNAQILGVSLDNVESHQAFSEKYSLPFPLLADLNKECATEYGVLGKFMMMTIAKRQSFVINPEGKIVKHYKKVDPDTHTEQVIGDLKKLTS